MLDEDCLDHDFYDRCKNECENEEDICDCIQAYEDEEALASMFPNDEDGDELQDYIWKDM